MKHKRGLLLLGLLALQMPAVALAMEDECTVVYTDGTREEIDCAYEGPDRKPVAYYSRRTRLDHNDYPGGGVAIPGEGTLPNPLGGPGTGPPPPPKLAEENPADGRCVTPVPAFPPVDLARAYKPWPGGRPGEPLPTVRVDLSKLDPVSAQVITNAITYFSKRLREQDYGTNFLINGNSMPAGWGPVIGTLAVILAPCERDQYGNYPTAATDRAARFDDKGNKIAQVITLCSPMLKSTAGLEGFGPTTWGDYASQRPDAADFDANHEFGHTLGLNHQDDPFVVEPWNTVMTKSAAKSKAKRATCSDAKRAKQIQPTIVK